MARRVRLTVFARFLIVMLFVIPLAYFGSQAITGDKIDLRDITKVFNKDEGSTVVEKASDPVESRETDDNSSSGSNDRLDNIIENQKLIINSLREQKSELESEVEKLKLENAKLGKTSSENSVNATEVAQLKELNQELQLKLQKSEKDLAEIRKKITDLTQMKVN